MRFMSECNVLPLFDSFANNQILWLHLANHLYLSQDSAWCLAWCLEGKPSCGRVVELLLHSWHTNEVSTIVNFLLDGRLFLNRDIVLYGPV